MSFDKGEWKPTPKQAQFLSLPLSIREAAYGGGAGSAKTDVLLIYALIHRWHLIPGFKQVFQRRTFPELRNEIIPRSRQIYPKFGATLNKSDMAWTFPRPDQFGSGAVNAGAMIFLGQCEDENDVHKYDSMEINLYTPDELTSFTEYIYLYIGFTRVRTSDPRLPAIIRTAGMPGGIGHKFFKKRFVDPYPAGGKIIVGRGGNKRVYIHATLADNPHLDPTYAASLEALPEAEKRAKKYGDWNSYLGQVFDEFRDRKYPDEPDNALHVIEPFEIPSWWPKLVIGDWGFAAMTYIMFIAISPTGRIYQYRELHWTKTKIAEWGPIVKDLIDRENPKVVKFCKSAGQDRGQTHTIQQQISQELGREIELSDNSAGSRIAGKTLIHEYLRWKPKPVLSQEQVGTYSQEMAEWLLRNKGMKEYNSYLATFNAPEPEKNIPKFQIFRCNETEHHEHSNCCPVMVDAIKQCTYEKKTKDGKPAEDIAEFDGDDPIDTCRYGLDSADRYFEECAEEFKKIQHQEELSAKLSQNNDWTAFYRNMRTVESDPNSGRLVLRRYHNSR